MKRIVWVALGLLVLTPAKAASFDCGDAASDVEIIICGDAELSQLDEELNAAYRNSLKDVKHAEAIKQSQKQWIKERNGCSIAGCVKQSYEIRLSLLKLPIVTTRTGVLISERTSHTATLLSNGKVLILGGASGWEADGHSLQSAELYDVTSGRFVVTGNLSKPRRNHSATLLPNGRVLVAGGEAEDGGPQSHFLDINDAELYDVASGTFCAAGRFPIGWFPMLLANGKVLFVKGGNADIYDPATGRFITAGNLVTPRWNHTTTLLPNGKVLLAGGIGEHSGYLAGVELYDQATNRFSAAGSLLKARADHSATLLPNGKVLVVGGHFVGTPISSAEIYDPATGRFTAAGELVTGRYNHSATLLPNGKVLIAGGEGTDGYLASIELYDPASGIFSLAGRLIAGRRHHTATLLPNGKVLFVGGAAELYDPDSGK